MGVQNKRPSENTLNAHLSVASEFSALAPFKAFKSTRVVIGLLKLHREFGERIMSRAVAQDLEASPLKT